MMQVMNLPYLLQSLVSTKAAVCAQPQSRGTVHHYPANCNGSDNNSIITEDRSCTTGNDARMNYQCTVESRVRNGTAGAVQMKREPMDDQTQSGCHTLNQYSPGPRDAAYHSYQNRYTLAYPPQKTCYYRLKVNPTHSALKTDMSLDIDSLFTQQQGPLSPLGLSPNQSSLSSYYSTTSSMADFPSIYDLPAQTLPEKTVFTDMMGGSREDICSPVFTKMDPNGCELLSLDDLSTSEFGYDDYLNSDVANSLDQDWLIEPVSLPSPEEQDSDIKYSSLPVPPQSLPLSATTQLCLNSSPSQSAPLSMSATSCMLTPDPSLPPSPSSILSYSSEEEEIKDVLASFNDESSRLDFPAPAQPFAPAQMLPLDCSQLLDVASPSSSCLMSAPSSPEEDSRTSFDGICDLLDQNKSSSRSLSLPLLSPLPHSTESVSGRTERSRKRKSLPLSSDQQSSAPAPASKRRMTKASKKERKKEQNKTAALRYRQKKKEEKLDIEVRCAELEDKNKDLKAQVTSLSNEINYLKKLWLEIRERKGQKS